VRLRQLCRIGATTYDESIGSLLFPGNVLSQQTLQQAVLAMETTLQLEAWQRPFICLRLDGGFGTDENLNWCLQRAYQIIAKGKSGKRANAWGRRVRQWQVILPDQRWIALSPEQLEFCVPTRTIALRWRNKQDQLKHGLLVVTDLDASLTDLSHRYNLRGAAEVAIRADKQGLLLTHRRKRAWVAQEIMILLNDLAHNFITTFRRIVLADTPLAEFGHQRLIQDVFTIPGQAIISNDHLIELQLLDSHPYARILADALPKLWQ
jgi:DDE family transposase